MILFPVPADVPPHEPVNHCTVDPVPALPPATVSVVLAPLQIVVVPVIPVGAVDSVLTVTVADAHVVLLHVPPYRTKYVVVVTGDTVMLFPVPADVPPHEPVNHCTVDPVPALPPATVSAVLAPLQIVVVPVIPVGAVESVFTVTVADTQVVLLHVPPYLT